MPSQSFQQYQGNYSHEVLQIWQAGMKEGMGCGYAYTPLDVSLNFLFALSVACWACWKNCPGESALFRAAISDWVAANSPFVLFWELHNSLWKSNFPFLLHSHWMPYQAPTVPSQVLKNPLAPGNCFISNRHLMVLAVRHEISVWISGKPTQHKRNHSIRFLLPAD